MQLLLHVVAGAPLFCTVVCVGLMREPPSQLAGWSQGSGSHKMQIAR